MKNKKNTGGSRHIMSQAPVCLKPLSVSFPAVWALYVITGHPDMYSID